MLRFPLRYCDIASPGFLRPSSLLEILEHAQLRLKLQRSTDAAALEHPLAEAFSAVSYQQGYGLLTVTQSADFAAERLRDVPSELAVELGISSVGTKSFVITHRVFADGDAQRPVATADVTKVCVDSEGPAELPPAFGRVELCQRGVEERRGAGGWAEELEGGRAASTGDVIRSSEENVSRHADHSRLLRRAEDLFAARCDDPSAPLPWTSLDMDFSAMLSAGDAVEMRHMTVADGEWAFEVRKGDERACAGRVTHAARHSGGAPLVF